MRLALLRMGALVGNHSYSSFRRFSHFDGCQWILENGDSFGTRFVEELPHRWYGVRAWQMVDRGHRLRQQQLLGDFLSSFQIQPPPDQTRQTIGRFVWTAACKQSTHNFHTIALWRRMLASCFSFSAPFIFLADHLSKEARIANRRTLGLCIGSAAQKNLHIRRI